MAVPIKIDFVSDVSCPWCVIGLKALEQALDSLGGAVDAEIRFQPFELNPQMGPDGENIVEHIGRKYGSTPEQSAKNREMIRARGEALGFPFRTDETSRIYNTFDAHRLLHWAGLEGRQKELKHALFDAYFTRGENPSDHETLALVAERAGLDPAAACEVLASGRYATEVRTRADYYRAQGINGVPAVILNERYLVTGGQPPEVFAQALRQVAAETPQADDKG